MRRAAFLALLLLIAPAAYGTRYPFHDVAFDLKTAATATETVIEGTAKNVRFTVLEGLLISASLRDGSGKEIGTGSDFTNPDRLRLDETGSFRIAVPARGKISGIVITYRYRYNDGDPGFTYDFHSFSVPPP